MARYAWRRVCSGWYETVQQYRGQPYYTVRKIRGTPRSTKLSTAKTLRWVVEAVIPKATHPYYTDVVWKPPVAVQGFDAKLYTFSTLESAKAALEAHGWQEFHSR